ncbi:MAG: polyprenyl synthetase family protein [Dehalococcoidia bacterium]|nr:polyprenyl synthetase family protein [Dehalococcoidia bacterium]
MSSAAAFEQRMERYRALASDEMRAVVGDGGAGLFGWMRYHLGWEDAGGRAGSAAPGKLMRAAGLLLATELVGGAAEPAAPAAAAVELVHNFSLLHDDIEDVSELRRGRAALWTLSGSAQAINTGDGMYTLARLAMHGLLDRGVEQRCVIEAMRELDEACLRLVEGQYMDLRYERDPAVTLDGYLAMASGKTAAMFAAPFAIGALLGGADGATVAAMREYGRHVGLAFQAVDDVLGIWGDPAVTGKPAGDDLRARKMTYPVLAALAAPGQGAVALARAYAQAPREEAELHVLGEQIVALGGRAATERFALDEERAALDALRVARLGAAAVADAEAYVRLAVGRVS